MKKLVIAIFTIVFCATAHAQNPSLELSWILGSWNPGAGPTQGPSVAPQTQTFMQDLLDNSNFSANTGPAVTVTTSLRNQIFTGYNYTGVQGTVTTGLSFGTQKSEWNDPVVTTQGPRSGNLYDLLGANVGANGPTASLYRSFSGEALGTIDADYSQFGNDGNGGVSLFSTVEPLRTLAGVDKAGRYEYGELVITFSRPVKDPVLHVASLGGSSWYQTSVGAPWNISYFSTEMELTTPGYTSVKLSGTPYLSVQGNKILNSAVLPNGDSQTGAVDVKGNSTFGAASGSVQVVGVVTQLVYKIYVRGSSSSDFPFSFDAVGILGASRNPFYGDYWSISYSMKKPTQQIFGNVFVDPQTTDGDINKSFGLANDRTNLNGQLYANLISGGLVVATTPISANGDYVFDNVAVGTYTVQLSSNQGVVGQAQPGTALPSNWINTGEFIGSGPGSDGTINGISASIPIAASSVVTNVNFGIKAGACPANILYQVPPTLTGYFGGFELTPAATNFYPTGVNLANGPGRLYANTPLAAANYSITTSPDVFDNTLTAYKALGGQNQMVVKPSASNQTVYYLMDSAGIVPVSNVQGHFASGAGSTLSGWFAKSSAADAVVKIRIYDADVPATVFKDVNITVSGAAGTWVYWSQAWTVNYGTPGLPTATKKIRFDIISVNGVPFSMDELCFTEPSGSPLPIVLSDFTVSKSACTANLVWKTSSESNSDRFDVEVSANNGNTYSATGTVAAAGLSSSTKTYQYNYPMQAGITYFFRIKMIDKDGGFKYSDTRSASCDKKGIVIAPNPVADKITISGMETGKNIITIYASNGQLVKSQTMTQTQGEVFVSSLAPGLYAVKITSEAGNNFIGRIIKQ